MEIDFPQYYLEWLSLQNTEEVYLYAKRDWYLMDEGELFEEVSIDKKCSPAYAQLTSIVKTQLEITGENTVESLSGENFFSIERVKQCATIGQCNGAPLFVDLGGQHSLWCYYSDGGDIEKVAANLEEFINNAIITEITKAAIIKNNGASSVSLPIGTETFELDFSLALIKL